MWRNEAGIWRPGSPLRAESSGKMRLCLRKAALGLAVFAVLSLLRVSVLLSGSVAFTEAQDEPDPRFRRAILRASEEAVDSSLFISVKTTQKYHATRLRDVLDTWFRLAPSKIWLFTDAADAAISEETDGHLVVTNCSASHRRQALCCKMGVEFDFFIRSGKSWMCHFDDDNYVNVGELERLLAQYDPREDLYIGRPSTRDPIAIVDRDNIPEKIAFWFATGGAGFCISKALATKMQPLAGNGRFIELGERIRLPDDVTVGFLIEHLLKRKLKVENKFHSHLETMGMIPAEKLHEQVSLSAGSYSSIPNVVSVPEHFPPDQDPMRFRSLHCHLFPSDGLCAGSRPAL